MAQQTINNGDSGLSARTKINDNFTETYAKQDTLVSGTNIKTVGGATLLGSGELVTGTPSGAKYLRDDLSWQTVTATAPDIALNLLAPSTDQTITAGYSAYCVDYYEIADTKFLEVGDSSIFEIG